MRAALIAGVVCLAAGVAAGVPLRAQDPAPEVRPGFTEWLNGVRSEALARGIREEIVAQALDGLAEPMPVVLERDRSQAEIVLPLETYVNRRLTRRMIASGRSVYQRHRDLLERIGAQYGVSPRIIVAIWGIESNYGRFSGVRPTVAALATLAYDPRRARFFRGELFNALEILNRGDIEFARMKGSWAGAMGQPQFMPSSYLKYAEDFDGDGRRDIWDSPADIFASVANYLKGNGWSPDARWGREVRLSPEAARAVAAEVGRREGTCQATRDMSAALPLAEWTRLGVRNASGGPLPKADVTASLVSGSRKHYLVYGNYDALLAYNCAHAYAISVSLLSDRIGGVAPAPAARPAAGTGRQAPRRAKAARRRTSRPRSVRGVRAATTRGRVASGSTR
ncbi:MAG: lytic transglycosylase domain-containing protein [Vicinamibacterales bacterium]